MNTAPIGAFQAFRNLKQDQQSAFVFEQEPLCGQQATEGLLFELPDDAKMARMFKMQVILDALNTDACSFVLHRMQRIVENILSLHREKDN